jgi:hypothetical protein
MKRKQVSRREQLVMLSLPMLLTLGLRLCAGI